MTHPTNIFSLFRTSVWIVSGTFKKVWKIFRGVVMHVVTGNQCVYIVIQGFQVSLDYTSCSFLSLFLCYNIITYDCTILEWYELNKIKCLPLQCDDFVYVILLWLEIKVLPCMCGVNVSMIWQDIQLFISFMHG